MSIPLLATKFYIPPERVEAVSRPRLIEKLLRSVNRPGSFILLAGPAGSGKTTLLSAFAAQFQQPVAWLSLDEGDNDTTRFWTYLISACQSILAGVGDSALELFSAPQPLPDDTVPTLLINDLSTLDRSIVVVLDDYHEIQNSSIHGSLLFLLDHLPDNLHIIVSTRTDPPWPLARYRARNRLVEIRAPDLRFSVEEAAEFLNQTMGLNLSVEDVMALEKRTEGWIAGLQLAAIAMQAPLAGQSFTSIEGRSDTTAFVKAITGSHVYVAEYLVEEVIQGQAQDVQAFLLQTSILERLNAELCDAVVETPGGSNVPAYRHANELLEHVLRANLFLVPLDDEGLWFRYHHLFSDLLQARLRQAYPAEAIARLHGRASRWYEAAGMMDDAIRHALAAGDYASAVRLIESHTVEMLVRGYSVTVQGWLNSIPAGLHFQSPKIHMAFIWMYMLQGNYAQIPPYVERLQAAFSDSPAGEQDPAARGEWLTLQSFLAGAQGKPRDGLALARQALEIIPPEDSYVQSMAYNALASAYQMTGDYARSVEACQKAILQGRATSNYFAEMMGVVLLVQIALQHGQYNFVFETASEGVRRIESSGLHSPISAVIYGALGQVHYQRHQIETARGYFLRALHLSKTGGYGDIAIYLRVVYSRLLQLEGDLEAANREIEQAAGLMQVAATAWARDEAAAQQVRVYLAQNRLAAAEMALRVRRTGLPIQAAVPDLGPGQTVDYLAGLLYNSALRILLQQARESGQVAYLRGGIELAENLISGALQGQYLLTAVEALLLRAQLHVGLGEEQAGLEAVARAVELAEPQGFISIFVEEGSPIEQTLRALLRQKRLGHAQADYVKSILAAFSKTPVSSEAAGLIEQLTPRELEVLELLAVGDSNQSIADKLVITVRTVKKHTSNIYGKLNVSSRTQAVARARVLELLHKD